MADKTIRCPNGCDPTELEREYFGGFWTRQAHDADRRTDKILEDYYAAGCRYHCQECDWKATWEQGKGLVVEFAGVGRE